jgi:hypothetical protein
MAMAILTIVVGAASGTHVMGLRMFCQARQNFEATDESRRVLGTLREEIRGCAMVQVGSGTFSAFKEVPGNSAQVGNALQIFPGPNTNSYVIYYRDTDRTIRRWSTETKRRETLAYNVTNAMVFKTTDYLGMTLTNNQNNRVVEITLKFLQEHGKDAAQHGGLHNFYQVTTKATRRKVL